MFFFFRGFQIRHSSKMFFCVNTLPGDSAGWIDHCGLPQESELAAFLLHWDLENYGV